MPFFSGSIASPANTGVPVMSSLSAHATMFADTSLLPQMDTDSTKERHITPQYNVVFGRGTPLNARCPTVELTRRRDSPFAGSFYLRNTLPPLASNELFWVAAVRIRRTLPDNLSGRVFLQAD